MKLLQLGFVFSLHAAQHVTDNQHERVKLRDSREDYRFYKSNVFILKDCQVN